MFYIRIALGMVLSITAAAQNTTTDVYCVHPQDSTAWYWLADGKYRIKGEYRQFLYQKKVYLGFGVNHEDYRAAKNACYEGWYPQPADTRFSYWRNFLINPVAGGDWVLAPGFISADLFIDEMLTPSDDFDPVVSCSHSQTFILCISDRMGVVPLPF